jgi:hypothetical protein
MGKKKTRAGVTSKGQRRSVVAGVKEVRAARTAFDKDMNKIKAWRKGKNPWITVPGPASNKRFVRVRSNILFGDPKKAAFGIYGKSSTND